MSSDEVVEAGVVLCVGPDDCPDVVEAIFFWYEGVEREVFGVKDDVVVERGQGGLDGYLFQVVERGGRLWRLEGGVAGCVASLEEPELV